MNKPGSNILYHPLVIKRDIPKIGAGVRNQIKKAIDIKLRQQPAVYGLPLRGSLRRYWKLRVGDYRVVYGIDDSIVYIHAIAHRKVVYQIAIDRAKNG